MKKTLVIGLGNPILGDDGIGWRIAEQVAVQLEEFPAGHRTGITIDCLALGGLQLMEHMIGYDRAIVIDAITTGAAPDGSLSCFPLTDLPNRAAGHLYSAHDTTLHNALQVGRTYGAHLPEEITIVAVEARQVYDFSEELSPPVAAVIPQAVETVIQLLLKEGPL